MHVTKNIITFLLARKKRLRYTTYTYAEVSIVYENWEVYEKLEVFVNDKKFSVWVNGYRDCFHFLVIYFDHPYLNSIKRGIRQSGINNILTFRTKIKNNLNYLFMETLILEPTENTPFVKVEWSGNIVIEGRCYPENAMYFFKPVMNYIAILEGSINIDINLDYINTSSSKLLHLLLLSLDEREKDIKSVIINWYYKDYDECILEQAQIYREFFESERMIFNLFSFDESFKGISSVKSFID